MCILSFSQFFYYRMRSLDRVSAGGSEKENHQGVFVNWCLPDSHTIYETFVIWGVTINHAYDNKEVQLDVVELQTKCLLFKISFSANKLSCMLYFYN